MTLDEFLEKLEAEPEQIEFSETIAVINNHFSFTPTAFTNGNQQNAVGENEGSCKILAFASQQGLSPQQTLHCFGSYYRDDVLNNPSADNHQNIRQFMKHGFAGLKFERMPLSGKNA